LIDAIYRRHPTEFAWTGTMDRLSGTDRARLSIQAGTVQDFIAAWQADEESFRRLRQRYLLY
jgi:uncharacterized protein YbbC (DUF1343 family)